MILIRGSTLCFVVLFCWIVLDLVDEEVLFLLEKCCVGLVYFIQNFRRWCILLWFGWNRNNWWINYCENPVNAGKKLVIEEDDLHYLWGCLFVKSIWSTGWGCLVNAWHGVEIAILYDWRGVLEFAFSWERQIVGATCTFMYGLDWEKQQDF